MAHELGTSVPETKQEQEAALQQQKTKAMATSTSIRDLQTTSLCA
jgi:hypothetical protein